MRVFEEVGYFPHFGAVICKSGPFRVAYVFLPVWFLVGYVTLYLLFKVGYQFVGEVVACNVLYGFSIHVSVFPS